MKETDAVKDASPTFQTVSTVTKECEKDFISFDFCNVFLQTLDNYNHVQKHTSVECRGDTSC